MVATVTGKNATIEIGLGGTESNKLYGISDFSISFSRGTSEQPLIGCEGNEFFEGAITIEGSYTCCKFASEEHCDALGSIVEGDVIKVAGKIGAYDAGPPEVVYLNWEFSECQVTSYGVATGNASKITEASIDFVVMNPHEVDYDPATGKVWC